MWHRQVRSNCLPAQKVHKRTLLQHIRPMRSAPTDAASPLALIDGVTDPFVDAFIDHQPEIPTSDAYISVTIPRAREASLRRMNFDNVSELDYHKSVSGSCSWGG
jgi:hypothetical protein